MRTIKFRAWDKDKRIMLSWEQIIHNSKMNLFGGLFELFRREEIKAMQFTGLQDKHGKDIYEGDILKIDWENCEYVENKLYNIKYYECTGAYCLADLRTDGADDIISFEEIFSSDGTDVSEIPLKIIGNIHENKDLITNK